MRRPTARTWLGVASVVALAAVVLAVVAIDHDAERTVTASSTTSAGEQAGTTEPQPTSTSTSTPAPTPTTSGPSSSSTAPPTTGGPSEPAVAIHRGDPDGRVVALTFDAGSDTGYASPILDTLAANGVPATFGMTGRWAEDNPALVRRMVEEGHQLVNHSYDHPSFTGRSTGTEPLSQEERLDQLARADAAIRDAAGVTTVPWFRPPYGDEDASVRTDVALAGYRYELMWTVDSLGWKGVAPADVVERCLDGAVPGAIFLLHVGAASTDSAALQPLIDGLRQLGYGFVTADGLIGG